MTFYSRGPVTLTAAALSLLRFNATAPANRETLTAKTDRLSRVYSACIARDGGPVAKIGGGPGGFSRDPALLSALRGA